MKLIVWVFRFLRGLEEMHIPKLLKDELGGGRKEFSLAEGKCQLWNGFFLKPHCQLLMKGANFVNIEQAEKFLSSAERQSILLHFLNSMRAEKGESVGSVTFREGEAISKKKLSFVSSF